MLRDFEFESIACKRTCAVVMGAAITCMACGAVRGDVGRSDNPKSIARTAPTSEVSIVLDQSTADLLNKPRFELFVPSVRQLVSRARSSGIGPILANLERFGIELASQSSEGVGADEVQRLLSDLKKWPDTSLTFALFAPDLLGKQRWAVRVSWPIDQLHERLRTLAAGAQEFFEGVGVRASAKGAYEVVLGESVIAHVAPGTEGAALLMSHRTLPSDAASWRGHDSGDQTPALLAARWNIKGTERDSGATFFSSFSAVTDVTYTGRTADNGDWQEEVVVHWPPISGMGVKAIFGRVRQTFFIPESAFGAAAFNAMMLPAVVDQLAGFGQQVLMDAPGEMEIVGEAGVGPVASAGDSELCVTLLPGTGFFPAPDLVLQTRTKQPSGFVKTVRKTVEGINAEFEKRDKAPPWSEFEVQGQTAFFSNGTGQFSGAIMPLVYRPVIFVREERDAKDRDRDFIVVAWTSTSPQDMVRRWINLPRTTQNLYLPQQRKTYGQLWLNWKRLYPWLEPYLRIPSGLVVGDAIFPAAEQMEDELKEALVSLKAGYDGLTASHEGPVPLGTLVVPALLSAAVADDAETDSDLGRERIACQRLGTLYHHATLFHQDIGRWPAELQELDGYVDFAGHPQLRTVEVSSRQAWGEFFGGLFDFGGKDDDGAGDGEWEDEEDAEKVPEDQAFVISWSETDWKLAVAPGKLEHLSELYIDHRGRIHRKAAVNTDDGNRVAKPAPDADPAKDESKPAAQESSETDEKRVRQ